MWNPPTRSTALSLALVCGIFVLAGTVWRATAQTTTRATQRAKIEQALSHLLDEPDYRKFSQFPKQWRESLSQLELKELIFELAARVESTKPLKTSGTDDIAITWEIAYEAFLGPPAKVLEDKIQIHNDIRTEGGRCADALERILNRSFSPYPFPKNYPPERRAAESNAIWRNIIRAMSLPVTAFVDRMTPAERAAAAARRGADPVLLRELASDPDPVVRRAVARTLLTPADVVEILRSDPDPEVRKNADANASTAKDWDMMGELQKEE